VIRHYELLVIRHARATPQTLFEIVSDGSRWSEWARPLISFSRWESLGPEGDGGVGAIRAVGTRRLQTREMTTVHEPGRRHGYTMLASRPVRNYHAEVRFVVDGDGTRVEWRGEYDTRWRLVGAAYRRVVRFVIGTLASKLVVAAERMDVLPKN
jgi:hypothetical protein